MCREEWLSIQLYFTLRVFYFLKVVTANAVSVSVIDEEMQLCSRVKSTSLEATSSSKSKNRSKEVCFRSCSCPCPSSLTCPLCEGSPAAADDKDSRIGRTFPGRRESLHIKREVFIMNETRHESVPTSNSILFFPDFSHLNKLSLLKLILVEWDVRCN